MKRVLIYCADITGHRHLYSAYFIRFFLNREYEVYFCYAGMVAKVFPGGRKCYAASESPYLEVFKEDPRVHFINISNQLNDVKNELNFISKLREELKPSVSLLIDGDILKYTLLKQLLPWQKRLQGNNFSIFCLSEFIYLPPGRFQVFKELFLFIYYHITMRGAVFDHRIKFVEKFPLLNRLFFNCIGRFSLLTTAFCPDPGLAAKYKQQRVMFLPEPITGNLETKLTEEKSSFYSDVESRYRDFLEEKKDKHVLLMFGDLEFRKGYDLLLQLAARDRDCVCVRFGRTRGSYTPTWGATLGKEKLLLEDRLFELDIYVESQELIEYIFSTVRFMVLPYRNYYRTSGVLIEVLRRGLPVLTSDKGYMAGMVRHYRVGSVFEDGSFQDLQKEFSRFKQEYKNYLKNIEQFNMIYWKENSGDILSAIIDKEKEHA